MKGYAVLNEESNDGVRQPTQSRVELDDLASTVHGSACQVAAVALRCGGIRPLCQALASASVALYRLVVGALTFLLYRMLSAADCCSGRSMSAMATSADGESSSAGKHGALGMSYYPQSSRAQEPPELQPETAWSEAVHQPAIPVDVSGTAPHQRSIEGTALLGLVAQYQANASSIQQLGQTASRSRMGRCSTDATESMDSGSIEVVLPISAISSMAGMSVADLPSPAPSSAPAQLSLPPLPTSTSSPAAPSQRLERAQGRLSALRMSMRPDNSAGTMLHALMTVTTNKAAKALSKSQDSAEADVGEETERTPIATNNRPAPPADQHRLSEEAGYSYPEAPSWLQAWRGGGVRVSDADAEIGFVADCASLGEHDDTLVVADGHTVSVHSINKATGLLQGLHTLKGHTDRVCSVACQGDTIVSGGRDRLIRIWSLSSGKCTATLEGCKDLVCGLALNGDMVLSGEGMEGKKVRLWSVSSAAMVALYGEHQGPVFGVALGGEVAMSASHDSTAKVWPTVVVDGAETPSLATLPHPDWVFSVSVEGSLAATGCRDGRVRLWDLATFTCTRTLGFGPELASIPSPVYSVRLLHGALFGGGESKELIVWSLAGHGECVAKLTHVATVRGLAVSTRGEFIISVGGKKVVCWKPDPELTDGRAAREQGLAGGPA